MSILFLQKKSTEIYTIAMNFLDKLPTGRTISSCTITATDVDNNTSATSTIIEDSAGTVNSTNVSGTIKNGETGRLYEINFLATLDNAEKINAKLYAMLEY